MHDTFTFNHHGIGIRMFDDVPYFCGRDIAKICGYKSGIPLRKEDKPIRSGSYNYISLYRIGAVLGRTKGSRREKAQELNDAIQKEFRAAMPIAKVPIPPAPVSDDYELRMKRNQLEMELDELRALEAKAQAAVYEAQRPVKEIRAKIFERERELADLRPQIVAPIMQKVIDHE